MSTADHPRVLLGVTGGIAAYKSPDIVRRLLDRGADVQVVMTHSAERLVSPTVFQAVSGRAVRGELWDEQAEAAMGHIELARWADRILIAPATAHVMSQLATGAAGSLLTTLCLASDAPVFLAPAMNQAMWRHPAVRANHALLLERGVRFIGPAEGEQACGDVGPGRMVEPESIVAALLEAAGVTAGPLSDTRVLITAGPTREPIDPVRFVSNRSSGKMGFAVAEAAAAAGAQVTLVAGPVNLPTPRGVERIDVETAAQMREVTLKRAPQADIYIGAAAISDYRPEQVAKHKIKKHSETLSLDMIKSPDVLAEVAALPARPFTVGFAAETQKLEEHARAKLQGKALDMIVGNLVGEKIGFDCDQNSALVLWADGKQSLPEMSKADLARRLVALIASHYLAVTKAPTPLRQPSAS
ncbi:MAG: bifunctional phosphopantothenoylcysteine decarboxylase/phosphopantothenate--cysteine ligase CoaBC [Chromatiales bacterium]|nr:MAG: bifunctional phosphopantothenoylcysteine decarboxylase/phosphopantothenate--cysteine ligase CoaBC [Chromatiales bacterium]